MTTATTQAPATPTYDPEFLAAIPGGHVLLPQPGEAPALLPATEEEEEIETPDTEAVPEETAEEQQPETDEDEEQDEADEESDDASTAPAPNAIRKMQKRISKLTARAKAAEAEIEKLRAAREPANEDGAQQEPRVVAAQPSGSGPLADVFDIAVLAERETAAENVMDWADANLDGAVVKLEDGTELDTAFCYVETFCDVAIRVMKKTNPSKIRDEARTVEIKARIDGVPVVLDEVAR
jgi:hypothetical protein